MELDTALGQDEKVSQKYEFNYSLLLFFLKSNFWLTNKRLIVNAPTNVFLFIPIGKDTVTYPLRAIATIRTKTQFKFLSLVGGVILLMIGLRSFVFLIFAFAFIADAFQTVIVVGSTGGGGAKYSYLPWEAERAKKMINELNQLIADI